jgi:hypothetical protein
VHRGVGVNDQCAPFIVGVNGGDARQVTEWASCSLYDRLDWGPAPSD